MARLTAILIVAFVVVAGYARLDRMYSRKFFDVTGRAQWIWAQHQLSADVPLAFFAARDFDLPPNRYYTKVKIAGDPEYTLYFNGREIGGRQFGEERHGALDVYDLSALARDGRNRLLIAVRSHRGVGGVIASVDISPEAENVVVTDETWRIFRRWSPLLPQRDAGPWQPPLLIGTPPMGRWNYPALTAAQPEPPPQRIDAPVHVFSFITRIPVVQTISGVAVRGSKRVRATAFDFGTIGDGRARLTINYDNGASRQVSVRFANERSELFALEGNMRPFVFAAGERTVIDPEIGHFRYVLVYGGQASADVVR
jgi:hypothetical protein